MSLLAFFSSLFASNSKDPQPVPEPPTEQTPSKGPFLTTYDGIQDPRKQIEFLVFNIKTNWRAMFAELREHRPIFQTPVFTLVTRSTDVMDMLAQPSLYSVKANRIPMDPSVGPFMLARDFTELNWHERGLMQAVLRRSDLPAVRTFARTLADEQISQAGGKMDLIPTLSRFVPMRIVQKYFGFDAPDANILDWSVKTQTAMFKNLTGDEDILKACIVAGQEMRAWLPGFLDEKTKSAGEAHVGTSIGIETAVDRMLALSAEPAADFDRDRVISNVCGLLVGTIETTSQAVAQIISYLLDNPAQMQAALAAIDDDEAFDAIVWEALRFDPITPTLFRLAEQTRIVGEERGYGTEIKAGTLLAVSSTSAMFDPELMPDPDAFKSDRPQHTYLHFGKGHHSCLGEYVGRMIIPETVRAMLSQPNLRRAEGAAGQIGPVEAAFPEHFHVEWG